MWRFALMLLALQAGSAAAAAPQVREPDQARRAELRHFLVHDCGSCHGLQMKGGLGPPLRAADLADRDDDALAWIVLNGLPGSAMPGWRGVIDDAEALWLIRTLKSEFTDE